MPHPTPEDGRPVGGRRSFRYSCRTAPGSAPSPPHHEAPPMQIIPPVSTGARLRRNTPTVVIADDDPVFRRLLEEYARRSGWQAVCASDAMQAVMYAVRCRPAAVLLDINMPGGTGETALARLRANAHTRSVPVIVVTGSDAPGLEFRVRDLGATGFLRKPVEPVAVQAALAAAIRASAAA